VGEWGIWHRTGKAQESGRQAAKPCAVGVAAV